MLQYFSLEDSRVQSSLFPFSCALEILLSCLALAVDEHITVSELFSSIRHCLTLTPYYCHRGVPRILENTLPMHLRSLGNNDDWEPFAEYLRTTRINVNVRQVFPSGFDPFA